MCGTQDGQMAGDDAVAVLGTGQCGHNVLGGGVSLTLPGELLADGGVEAGVEDIVDRQMEGDGAVAAMDTVQCARVVAALGEGLAVPSVGTANRLGEIGLVGRIHHGDDGGGRTFATGGFVKSGGLESGGAADAGGVTAAAA